MCLHMFGEECLSDIILSFFVNYIMPHDDNAHLFCCVNVLLALMLCITSDLLKS